MQPEHALPEKNLRTIVVGKYRVDDPKQEAPPKKQNPKAASVRWRIKGNADGHVYEGQKVVRRCAACPPNPL
jgi:hypothetical protein